MKAHREQFVELMKEINSAEIDYVIIRGFLRLPDSPDNDIDLVTNGDSFEKCVDIVKKDWKHNYTHNHGFAEYSNMINTSYHSVGPDDAAIAHKRFYVDTDSGLFFKSPMEGFKTYWTVPKKFNDYVFETKIKRELGDTFYYIPSPECEYALQILRNVLDLQGKWKPKSVVRVEELLKVVDDEEAINCISMALPNAEQIHNKIKDNQLNEIFKLSMGGKL